MAISRYRSKLTDMQYVMEVALQLIYLMKNDLNVGTIRILCLNRSDWKSQYAS
jgi:hypothetical protein